MNKFFFFIQENKEKKKINFNKLYLMLPIEVKY